MDRSNVDSEDYKSKKTIEGKHRHVSKNELFKCFFPAAIRLHLRRIDLSLCDQMRENLKNSDSSSSSGSLLDVDAVLTVLVSRLDRQSSLSGTRAACVRWLLALQQTCPERVAHRVDEALPAVAR